MAGYELSVGKDLLPGLLTGQDDLATVTLNPDRDQIVAAATAPAESMHLAI